ncbi:hypothetical protein TrLO_g392 [Triparma laevis f. longispina]|uniref:Uncharacterized protein n=1 Tax=Triparma laevis f. longispina TaxID=1714387 RepID=A0A9W7FCU3_9STRA|nr:hypothetical protein TrLO_g392 [Triparma laevis f. longispina]
MDVYGDSTGAVLVGQQKFPLGMGVVTQQFDAYKESGLLRRISARETFLQSALHEAQESANFHPYNPAKLFTALVNLRMSTADVIEGIEDWRNGLVNPEPFIVAGENYLLKIIKDCDAFRIMPTVDLYGFELGLRNPFAFPCQPRIAIKQALEERRRKQRLERKKEEKQKKRDKENPNLQNNMNKKKKKKPEEEKAHSFHLKKGEYVLPRAKEDIEEFHPPHDVGVLMLDFSQVDENNWVRICKAESILKDEEDRYSKKVSGPAVAGTGWGLERWSKMAWQAPKVKPKQDNPEEMLLAVNQKHGSDSETESDDDPDSGPFVKKNVGTHRRTAISGTSLLAAKKSRFTGSALALSSKLQDPNSPKGSTTNKFSDDIKAAREKHNEKKRRKNGAFKQKNEVFARMSKEEKRLAMAMALEEEKKAMYDNNRSSNIPSCADFIQNIEDINSGSTRKKSVAHAHKKASKKSNPQTTDPDTNFTDENPSLPKLPNSHDETQKDGKKKRKPKSSIDFPDPGGVPPTAVWDFDPSIEILGDDESEA